MLAPLVASAGAPPGTAKPASQELDVREGRAGAAATPRCLGKPAYDCHAFGYAPGPTVCTPEGEVDITGCMRSTWSHSRSLRPELCGNGRIDTKTEVECPECFWWNDCLPCEDVVRKLEECDGKDLDGKTCWSLGYLDGDLACTAQCTLDTGSCRTLAADFLRQPWLTLPGLARFAWGDHVAGALSAVSGAVGVAWRSRRLPGPESESPAYEAVFAWADPDLRVLRTTRPFPVGHAGSMQLGGNERGWLLAVATYGDTLGPSGPGVRTYPISPRGDVGPPGANVPHQEALFLVRGAGGEPSLVGALNGFIGPDQPVWALDGWLVDDRGEPLTKPFQIGTPVLTYSVLGARAVYLGGGRFAVARGSTRSPAIEIALVDVKGQVQVLPAAHPRLVGTPVDIFALPDRLELIYLVGSTKSSIDPPSTYAASVSLDGKLIELPRRIDPEPAFGVAGAGAGRVLVTRSSDHLARQHLLSGGAPKPLAGAPDVLIPLIVSAGDASYALLSTSTEARLLRLR